MRILHSKKLVFVSKPRCGSTSVRRILDNYREEGDEYCDYAGQFNGLHPHMTAAAIANYINKIGKNSSEYTFFTITRHPLEMLWSYYKFFQPDANMRYNWDENHVGELLNFEDWLKHGKVGLGNTWKDFVPSSVTKNDLSPLSLDAHVLDSKGRLICPNIFKVEEREKILCFLSEQIGETVKDLKVNQSKILKLPDIPYELVSSLRKSFSMDFDLYE